MNNTQAVMAVAKQRRAELELELDTINKFVALFDKGKVAKKASNGVASTGTAASSARSEAMKAAWAKRKAAKGKAPKKTAGASLADVA